MFSCVRSAVPAAAPETLAPERLEALRKYHWSAVAGDAGTVDGTCASNTLTVCTFNMLAPCYKRVRGSGRLGESRESQDRAMWQERLDTTTQFMQQQVLPQVDILGLQEYWFEPEFEQRFARAVGTEFEIRTHRRVGGKADGVAFVLRKARFELLAERGFALTKIGSRVGLTLLLHDRWTKQRLLMTVTHLSFPHCDFSRDSQVAQGRSLLRDVSDFARQHGLGDDTPRIIVGDFNAELSEPPCQLFLHNDYVEAFSVTAAMRGLDASTPGGSLFVSHHTHREEEVAADHIFFRCGSTKSKDSTGGREEKEEEPKIGDISRGQSRNGQSRSLAQNPPSCRMFVDDWYMLPAEMDVTTWPEEFQISDHRPVGAVFRILSSAAKPTARAD